MHFFKAIHEKTLYYMTASTRPTLSNVPTSGNYNRLHPLYNSINQTDPDISNFPPSPLCSSDSSCLSQSSYERQLTKDWLNNTIVLWMSVERRLTKQSAGLRVRNQCIATEARLWWWQDETGPPHHPEWRPSTSPALLKQYFSTNSQRYFYHSAICK